MANEENIYRPVRVITDQINATKTSLDSTLLSTKIDKCISKFYPDTLNYLNEFLSTRCRSVNTADYVYALFEANYGDLHSYMKEKKKLSELEARKLFKQCVKCVSDCHAHGILVRDIKLKKFVFLDAERTRLGLLNLDECLLLDENAENDFITSQQGCPPYVSPEVLNSQHESYSGMLSDSWSLGVVLYTLLFGRYPFHHQVIASMFARIARGKFQIPPSSGLTLEAKILLRSLIRLRPDERMLPRDILCHSWFKLSDERLADLAATEAAPQPPQHRINNQRRAEFLQKNPDYFMNELTATTTKRTTRSAATKSDNNADDDDEWSSINYYYSSLNEKLLEFIKTYHHPKVNNTPVKMIKLNRQNRQNDSIKDSIVPQNFFKSD
jgi:tribbles-like protein